MSSPDVVSVPTGPTALVQSLIGTLTQEEGELILLHEQFGQQLDALRHQNPAGQEEAMHASIATINALGKLRATRERQMRLLGRVLRVETEQSSLEDLAKAMSIHGEIAVYQEQVLSARSGVREQAEKTRSMCEQLEFALQYAASLGREMMQVVQALDVPPPAKVYTARGGAQQAVSPRSFVNRVG